MLVIHQFPKIICCLNPPKENPRKKSNNKYIAIIHHSIEKHKIIVKYLHLVLISTKTEMEKCRKKIKITYICHIIITLTHQDIFLGNHPHNTLPYKTHTYNNTRAPITQIKAYSNVDTI